mgnify:FL=1|jgi:hypothetical protein
MIPSVLAADDVSRRDEINVGGRIAPAAGGAP